MNKLIHKVSFHNSTHDIEKIHDWVIARFGKAYNYDLGEYDRWIWGYQDSGHLNLRFALEEDAVETMLRWK